MFVCTFVLILMYLSRDEVLEGMAISQISGQNKSLPTATLWGVADAKQSVIRDRTQLEGQKRKGWERISPGLDNSWWPG